MNMLANPKPTASTHLKELSHSGTSSQILSGLTINNRDFNYRALWGFNHHPSDLLGFQLDIVECMITYPLAI